MVVELVKAERIGLSKSITHRLPFKKLNCGLDILDEKKEDAPGIALLQ